MNNYSLSQISKTANFDSNLITRYYKPDKMAEFMKTKSNNPKMTQKEICNQVGLSDRTISRFRKNIDMISPYKLSSPHHKNDKIRLNPPHKCRK